MNALHPVLVVGQHNAVHRDEVNKNVGRKLEEVDLGVVGARVF